jgi:serine protease Do
MARPIMASLVKSGHVTRGYLGVVIQDIDRDLAQAMKLQAGSGALVADVEDDSPAAKAGIQRGDVIRALDGKKVDSTSQLRNRIAALAPGAVVRVELLRDGAPRTVEVKLEARAADQEQPGQGSGGPRPGQPDRSTETEDGLLGGATLHELTPALRQRLDVPADVTAGVVVERVAPGSGADKLGLQRGDVLVEIDRRKVSSPAEVRAASKQLGDAVAVRIVRQGRSLYLASRK